MHEWGLARGGGGEGVRGDTLTKTRWIGLLAMTLSGCQALWGFEEFLAGGGVSGGGEGGEAGAPVGQEPGAGGALGSEGGTGAAASGGSTGTGGNHESAGGGPVCATGERGCIGRYNELLAYVCNEEQSEKIFSDCKGEFSQCSMNYGCVSVELDEYEISLQQYFEFVEQSEKDRESGEFSPFSGELAGACGGTDVAEMDPRCAGETSHCRACFECKAGGGECVEACSDCDRDLPMVCVNWCQATAYCRFNGGRLCGGLGPGGAIDAPAPFSDLSSESSPEESAWSHVCAATAPWSRRTYSPGLDDLGECVFGGGTSPTIRPANGPGECRSVIDGYSDLNHLSGNVAEWEDSCADTSDPSAECRVRGGSFRNWNAEELACSSFATMARDAAGPHVGFRCCYPGGRAE